VTLPSWALKALPNSAFHSKGVLGTTLDEGLSDFPPPPHQGQKTTASGDQTWKSCTDYWPGGCGRAGQKISRR
jgi:hypothetical protein